MDILIRNAEIGQNERWIDNGDNTFSRKVALSNTGLILSDEMTRPSDTTQYSQYSILGVNYGVSGITANPSNGLCLVQVPAGVIDTVIKDQDIITISSVGGTIEANGNVLITRVDSTHFTIPVPFVNTYTSGGAIARLFQMNLASVLGGSGIINYAQIKMNTTVTLNAVFDLYAFDSYPGAILDKLQVPSLYANPGKYLGTFIPIVGSVGSGGTGSDSIMAIIPNINITFQAQSGSQKVFFRLINNSTTGFVPTSGMKTTLIIGTV